LSAPHTRQNRQLPWVQVIYASGVLLDGDNGTNGAPRSMPRLSIVVAAALAVFALLPKLAA